MATSQVPNIFDRRLAAAKWARARSRQSLGGATYLADTMAKDIAERLDFMRFEPVKALIVGEASGELQSSLAAKGTAGNVGLLGTFDEEQPGPSAMFDMIVHLLGLGMVNDLPGALIHGRNALAEDGLFIAAFPGAGSLPVLRQIAIEADCERPAARIHPQVDIRAATGLMERAGFKRQVVDSYPIRVRFPSFERMINDLRDHGLTRSLTSPVPPLTRDWLERAKTAFEALKPDDGKVVETFEILVLTGWKN